MWIYILMGFFAGTTFWNIFTEYISPTLLMKQEEIRYKTDNTATIYKVSSEREMLQLEREYPELKEEPAEFEQAIGFQYPESEDSEC